MALLQCLVIGAVVAQRGHDALTGDMPDQLDRARPLGRERQHHEPAPGGRLQAAHTRRCSDHARIAGDEPRAARLRD